MVECRTPEWEVRGSKPTAAVLCPWARHFTPRKYWLITQEAMAPSWHDWKIVDWDVKPQHNQPTLEIFLLTFIELCMSWPPNLVVNCHTYLLSFELRAIYVSFYIFQILILAEWIKKSPCKAISLKYLDILVMDCNNLFCKVQAMCHKKGLYSRLWADNMLY